MKTLSITTCITASIFALCLMAVSCEEEPVGQFPTDSLAPSRVTNVVVEPIPGGAEIYFDCPDETDIAYVECIYVAETENKIARASIYRNHLTIEGLNDTNPCPFSLYLVDNSENRSEAYSGSFTPLESPLVTSFASLTSRPDFGGARFQWTNETKSPLGIYLLEKDENGNWKDYDFIISSLPSDARSIRGHDPVLQPFGVVMTDRFGHYSDTLVVEHTPLFEKMLDKKLFVNAALKGDNNTTLNARPIQNAWDGNYTNLFHSDPNADISIPQYFTIDFGVLAQLSRFKYYPRYESLYFSYHNIRYFEVWATNELKEPANSDYWTNGAWKNDWEMLGDYEVVQPSGLGPDKASDEDIAASKAGFEFGVSIDAAPARYVRFVVKETWLQTAALYIAELDFFGGNPIGE